jgi:hypothetical protein
MAEEREIEGWEEMDKKALLVALEPSEKEPEVGLKNDIENDLDNEITDEELKPEPTKELVSEGIKESHVPVGSKAEAMREKLSKQPKVRILIPLGNEKIGAVLSVILNGYRLNIMKGVYVDVPEQVANVIMKSQKQTVSAMNNSLNLSNPNHPKSRGGSVEI